MKDISSCAQIVRDHDYDRYVTSMFADVEHREALFALYAFNYEVSKTREVVSDTTLGLIRLTWWREAIDEIYDGKPPRKHEVVTPLADVISKYKLPKKAFETLIYAREFDLEDVLPSDMKGLRKYIEYTLVPLFDLAAQILNDGKKVSYDFKPLSFVVGASGLLRALPYHAAQRRCYLPEDRLKQEEVSANDIYNGDNSGELRYVIYELVEDIERTLDQLNYDENLKPLMLQVTRAKQSIKRLKKYDYNPFLIPEKPDVFTLRLMLAYYLKRF
jgi:phytoene synthase